MTLETAHGMAELTTIKNGLRALNEDLNGDGLLVRYEGQSRMSLKGRVDLIVAALWATTQAPTGTYERAYEEANAGFGEVLSELKILEVRLRGLEASLANSGAPYTPGQFPVWD